MARKITSIEIEIDTTNGHLSVDMIPIDEEEILTGDELAIYEMTEQIKSAVFQVLRQAKFTGK